MNQCFKAYEPYRGDIAGRRVGVMVAMEAGTSTQYAIEMLVERGTLFYGPGEDIYVGLVVGERPIANDMYVNIVRAKHLTNVRSSTKEELTHIAPPRRMSLDQALEYVADDEWLEVTPGAVRIRKREVDYKPRLRSLERRYAHHKGHGCEGSVPFVMSVCELRFENQPADHADGCRCDMNAWYSQRVGLSHVLQRRDTKRDKKR